MYSLSSTRTCRASALPLATSQALPFYGKQEEWPRLCGWEFGCWYPLCINQDGPKGAELAEPQPHPQLPGPLNLAGERSLPHGLRGAGRDTDSWFFGRLQATCDA